MNAGMYGMADGRGMAGRKLAGHVGKHYVIDMSAGFARLGLITNSTGSISARTRLLSINGKGAARWLGLYTASGTIKVEVWIDGVPVIRPQTDFGSTQGACIFGQYDATSYSLSSALDWVPFDSSYEVFVTPSSSISVLWAHHTDLHQ